METSIIQLFFYRLKYFWVLPFLFALHCFFWYCYSGGKCCSTSIFFELRAAPSSLYSSSLCKPFRKIYHFISLEQHRNSGLHCHCILQWKIFCSNSIYSLDHSNNNGVVPKNYSNLLSISLGFDSELVIILEDFSRGLSFVLF